MQVTSQLHKTVGNPSFRTQVISYQFCHFLPFWSFRIHVLDISYPVTTISYSSHFEPTLVILYLVQLGTKRLLKVRSYSSHVIPTLVISYIIHFVCIFVSIYYRSVLFLTYMTRYDMRLVPTEVLMSSFVP